MDTTGLTSLILSVVAPIVAGLLSRLVPRGMASLRTVVALAGPAASVWLLVGLARAHGVGVVAGTAFLPELSLDVSFWADGLGLFFGLLVSGIGCLIVLYARGYFGRDDESLRRFFPTLGFFATAMMGIVLADSYLLMFVFWELTSVSSFLLIGWDRDNPRAVRLAMQAFVVTGSGGMALLGGLLMLGVATGAWSFSALGELASAGALMDGAHGWLVPWALGLAFAGGAAKSAQFPLHFWLPGAMAAPTPVSAYLHSATMVKAGVFLFGRLFPVLSVLSLWTPLLVVFGSVTMLYGAYVAVRSQELKKIFAYTTVSQLGLLTCAYGLGGVEYHGESNLIWPVTQVLNHAIYKAPLFIIAGAIMHSVGRKELQQLRGLIRSHAVLALTCLAGCYALAGGPLTLSFVMKEAFFYQIVHAAEEHPAIWAVGVMGVLTASCNVVIFVRFLTTFVSRRGGEDGREEHDAHAHDDASHAPERGFWGACIWWPAAFLVAWQFVGGVWPSGFESIVRPVETHPHYFEHLPSVVHAVTHPSAALAMSAIGITLGVIVGLTPLGRRVWADPFDRAFPLAYRGLEAVGYRLMRIVQSGRLRTYVFAVTATMIAGLGLTLWRSPRWRAWPEFEMLSTGELGFALAGVFLAALICATALLLVLVRSRITRVLVLGACGFCVTGMYLVYQAPDLALTQLMFEIISVVLFMLVFRLLPETPAHADHHREFGRLGISVLAGVAIGWTVLHAGSVAESANRGVLESRVAEAGHVRTLAAADHSGHGDAAGSAEFEPTGRLGDWFLRHSYEGSASTGMRGGGGNNVVNVILVDFRGYDTLGEITVLSIAMMGVLALLTAVPARSIRYGGSGEHGTYARTQPVGPQPHLRSVLLRTAMRLILPLSLIFAGYVFFKGHQEPGGGFIAGLIASVGLAVYRMSEGQGALTRLVPVRPGKIAAVGLALALATGMAPMVVDVFTPSPGLAPFLTSAQFDVPRPGASAYHLPSVAFFDLGVFIVVVGVSVGMINRFEEELE